MAGNPPFYQQITALDRNRHGDLFVAPKGDYRFAAGSNAVFLAAAEFGKAMHHYPIVFGEDAGRVFPVAVLGVRDKENLFLDQDGNWQADYIPAYVRRYPFILASGRDSDNLTVCIDQTYPGFNRDGQGERLFEGSEQTEYLKRLVAFLQDYQVQYERTARLCSRLSELALFEPMQANMELPDGSKFNLRGFQVINRKKLKELEDAALLELARSGALELIHLHLHSLDSFNRFPARIRARQQS